MEKSGGSSACTARTHPAIIAWNGPSEGYLTKEGIVLLKKLKSVVLTGGQRRPQDNEFEPGGMPIEEIDEDGSFRVVFMNVRLADDYD